MTDSTQDGEIDRKGEVAVVVGGIILALPAFTTMDYAGSAAMIAFVGVVLLAYK